MPIALRLPLLRFGRRQGNAKLQGTSGGAVPDPGEPQITPTSEFRRRNDFPAFAYLGGYTGGNLSPVSVEPILLDPGDARLNEKLIRRALGNFYSAPQQLPALHATTGLVGDSFAQTPEHWDHRGGGDSLTYQNDFESDTPQEKIVGDL